MIVLPAAKTYLRKKKEKYHRILFILASGSLARLANDRTTGFEITAGHHCGGETFQSIFSPTG